MTNQNDTDQYRGIDFIARDGDGHIQRRTIVQSAAWSIPVVALAVATPAAAASAAPALQITSTRITRDPSWNGQDAQGHGYVDQADPMVQDFTVANNGTGPAPAGWTISLDLLAATVHGDPVAPAGFTYTGATQYTFNGTTRYVYHFASSTELAAGASVSGRITWTTADGNTIKNGYGNGPLSASANFSTALADGSGGSTVNSDTQLSGSPTYVIRY